MKWPKRKLEVFLIILVVAVLALFLRTGPVHEPPEPSPQTAELPRPQLPQAQLSEDARWILSTAADSYTPRVPVERAWEQPLLGD